jgi:hypothetical protein
MPKPWRLQQPVLLLLTDALVPAMDYHHYPRYKGDTKMAKKTETFREKLGDKDIELDEYKVDDLRKIASEYDVAGSHDMHKGDLVNAINRARRNQSRS